jgi:hypothetical protein
MPRKSAEWTPEMRKAAGDRARAHWARRNAEMRGRRFRLGRLVIVWTAR